MKRAIRLLNIIILIMGAIFVKSNNCYAYECVNIVIDAGHGGDSEKDSERGAAYNGYEEKDINLITAKYLKEYLEEYGNVQVYLTRESDTEMSLEARADYAASVNADYLISIHYNASNDHLLYGSEIYVSGAGENYAKCYSLGQLIMNNWVELGSVSKGIKTRIGNHGDYYGIIRNGCAKGIPTMILEHAYLDNDHDEELVSGDSAFKKFAKADAEGIAAYFGLKKNVVLSSVFETKSTNVPSGVVRDDTTPPTDISMEILAYKFAQGKLKFKLTAREDESQLMFYQIGTKIKGEGSEAVITDTSLIVWDKDSEFVGSFELEPEYRGDVYVSVYNNFDKYATVKVGTVSKGKFTNSSGDEEDILDDFDEEDTSGIVSLGTQQKTTKKSSAKTKNTANATATSDATLNSDNIVFESADGNSTGENYTEAEVTIEPETVNDDNEGTIKKDKKISKNPALNRDAMLVKMVTAIVVLIFMIITLVCVLVYVGNNRRDDDY